MDLASSRRGFERECVMVTSFVFGFLFYALPAVFLAVVSDALRRSGSRRIVAAAEILFILSFCAELLRYAAAWKPGQYLLPDAEDFIRVHQWLVTAREALFSLACLLLAIWAVGLLKRLKNR